MQSPFRLFSNLIGFALAALWLATPATAWNVHQMGHGATPVAVDQHHSHEDGRVVVQDEGSPADQDRQKDRPGGHVHMLSLSGGISATLPCAATLAPEPVERMMPEPALASLTLEIIEPPPARPPRFS